MEKKVTFLGREHTAALDKHIDEQLARIERFLADEPSPRIIELSVEFHAVHQHNRVVARVKSAHYDCYAEHEGPDEISEINEVVDRLYAQLREQKRLLVDRHKKGCGKECRDKIYRDIEAEIEFEKDAESE
ncbi:MAG: HPF/RaiA family ribosome-associated protein [Candidatus Dependentiae bacterium]|nr:HPF/RaiA family ribosome-associated protein [Candidatus Dependentiae bacterium]